MKLVCWIAASLKSNKEKEEEKKMLVSNKIKIDKR